MSASVSIVTRTRNRPELLRRCIDSVIAQSYGAWRQYIVNDGGPREPVDAVVAAARERAAGRLEVLHLERQGGMEAATNHALRRARERWVVLLDDDDTWLPGFLDATVQAIERRSSLSTRAVVTQSLLVEERLEPWGPVELRRSVFNANLGALALEALARTNQFTNNALLFERDALEHVGLFCEELPVYGDWDFNLRFLQAFDIAVLEQPLACWHQRRAASGDAQNSFAQAPGIAGRARAQLTNLWLRGTDGRSPHVGALMALGPFLAQQERLAERLDKAFNALHRVRRLPVIGALDRALRRGAT